MCRDQTPNMGGTNVRATSVRGSMAGLGGGSGYRRYSDTTYRTWTLSPLLCHGAKRLPNEISLGGCKSYNMRLALLTPQTR